MWSISFVFITLILQTYSETFDDLVVELPQGKIRGHILENGIGKNFLAFQEIPYAAPPTGKNRFKEPKDPEKWPGILNTTKNSKICIQNFYRPENLESTEDCLYLNVYVSGEIRQEPLLPVLFYIHGGGFTTESGAIEYYNPKYLMDQEIIVVSPNYRLGIFGFLTTSDGVIPGNLGLKDQFLALKWVHKYIHLFGGDKNRITVVGHSAGAVCASFIQQSPLSRGLVKSYIILSGTSLSPYTYQSKPDYYAFKLGRALDKNFTSNSSSDLLKLLYRFSAQEIIDAVVIDDIFNRTLSPSIIWIPTIESPTYENAFLTTPMLEAFTKGDFQKVPLLMGTTSSEGLGLMPSMDKLIPEARKYDRNISMLLHPRLKISEDSLEEASRLYKSVYTSTPFEEDINAFIKCLGDDLFSTPLFHHAMLASKYSPVYFLQFSYKGPMGAGDANYSDVGHAEDIHYVFTGISGFKNSPEIYSESDQLTMRRMLAILTNFVKYQNPTPEKNDLFEEIVWPPMRGDNIQYMNFNRTLTINKGLLLHYREVKQIFDKYAKRSYTFF